MGEVEQAVQDSTFDKYASDHDVPSVRVELDEGDLYFFYTENVHEVPKIDRTDTRVVPAVFVAMSEDWDEIFVWS